MMSGPTSADNTPWTLPRGDAERGKLLYAEICANCHSLDPSGNARSGPSLAGIWGRKAGTLPGFRFADSVEKKGIVWSDRTLWDYFDRKHIPGTKMFFRLLHNNEKKRADLLTYLKEASAPSTK